ncbi:hypothetical protein THAOC_29544 [Thalassiosira oceanica]|uniref:Uncharacterized protein n=1 Tax=Thalassiosira oceanica TaxID=159749 RepID=K0RC60_THAOC|nr:hypothetical protein THAOC_29544 [Thalassiosira oceanica]|eukprot:EJK51298.1 hypothetical protein THAOC_29544 [Thalassiosira oceanica]
MLPGDEIETEKEGICPSNCNIKPFDASFPPRLHSCHYTDIGFDYTLSPPPPPSSIDPTTDIQQQLSANAERCHQRAERAKYRRGGDTVDDADLSLPDPPSSKDLGELYIEEINRANNRLLLPVSIGPYGDFGPIFRNFLFGQGPRQCPPAPVPVQGQTASQPRPPARHLAPRPLRCHHHSMHQLEAQQVPTFLWPFLHGTNPTRTFPPEVWAPHHKRPRRPAPQYNSFKHIVSAPPGLSRLTTAHRTPPGPAGSRSFKIFQTLFISSSSRVSKPMHSRVYGNALASHWHLCVVRALISAQHT